MKHKMSESQSSYHNPSPSHHHPWLGSTGAPDVAPRSAIQAAKTRPKAPVPPLSSWQPWLRGQGHRAPRGGRCGRVIPYIYRSID